MDHTLVLGSGGIKGFCYLGACKELDESLIKIRRFGGIVGCSIGSLIGVLIASGYTPIEIFREFLTTEFDDMLQPGSIDDMIDKGGLFDNSQMKKFLESLVEQKLGRGDLNYREFYETTGVMFHTITTDVENSEVRVLNYHLTPEYSVVEGVIASCSIPFIIQGTVFGDGIIVDGASMDPLGLKIALEYARPGGVITCMFFANRTLSERIFQLYPECGGMEEVYEYWHRMEMLEPIKRRTAETSINRILTHGKKVFRCFMEAMMENYIFRYVLENRMAPPESRKTIRLLPMPNFESTIFSSPEMKIHMYFTGTDVIKAMIKEKYLS